MSFIIQNQEIGIPIHVFNSGFDTNWLLSPAGGSSQNLKLIKSCRMVNLI